MAFNDPHKFNLTNAVTRNLSLCSLKRALSIRLTTSCPEHTSKTTRGVNAQKT